MPRSTSRAPTASRPGTSRAAPARARAVRSGASATGKTTRTGDVPRLTFHPLTPDRWEDVVQVTKGAAKMLSRHPYRWEIR